MLEYAVEIRDKMTLSFLEQKDVFKELEDAQIYIQQNKLSSDEECYDITYIEYDESGEEIARGSVFDLEKTNNINKNPIFKSHKRR